MNRRWAILPLGLYIAFPVAFGATTSSLEFKSSFLRVELVQNYPAFTVLAVDSLGKNGINVNPVLAPVVTSPAFLARPTGKSVEYRPAGKPLTTPPAWNFEVSARQIRLASSYIEGSPPPPLTVDFDPRICHATLLGLINPDGSTRLPALLHLPDHGTLRITSTGAKGLNLGFEVVKSSERGKPGLFVRITFPGASRVFPRVDYTLDVVAIYPGGPELAKDPRFDGFRRNFLNAFQISPRERALAVNVVSLACSLAVYETADVAMQAPPLAPGLTALDLVRQTLDRYLNGLIASGMKGYVWPGQPPKKYDFLDTYPSLVITATDYVLGSHDTAWLRANYASLQAWAGKISDSDRDGDGLIEYAPGPDSINDAPGNWWDTIWFTNKDAFCNALAYRAWQGMAKVARLAGKPQDESLYQSRAERIRALYVPTFYDPASGVLAGWKDIDGKLHNYYFTFVNGMAISFGLVPAPLANKIMDRMLAKMKEVGYDRFDLGLPGNLIPIRKADYGAVRLEHGGPQKEDGSDGFQYYENGGATAAHVYFTLDALYRLGRREDADRILFPLLQAFEEGKFQGFGPNGRSYDWKRWDGTPEGYEGLLMDNYTALLAVLSRQSAAH